jgi:hypothetical protein
MRPAGTQRLIVQSTQLIVLFVAVCIPAWGIQEPRLQDHTAPPPLKIISRQERSQISASKDSKARVRLTIELAETHLANAETKTSQQDYDGAAASAGKYWALFEDALAFLKTIDRDSNKTRDLYKRVELALRAHGPRLSALRRTTPAEYAIWIKEIEDLARKGRTEALNSFYGQTVVRDNQQTPASDQKGPKPMQKNAIAPEVKQP